MLKIMTMGWRNNGLVNDRILNLNTHTHTHTQRRLCKFLHFLPADGYKDDNDDNVSNHAKNITGVCVSK